MAKTRVKRIQESAQATNIYLENEAALHLAHRLIRQAERKSGVRIVVLNKDEGYPDFQVYAYDV